MAEFTVTVNAEFDNILDVASEIGELQTYKLSEDSDMLLVSLDDVAEVLRKHIKFGKEETE